ncbi:hypothetical protein [Sphingomonas sp. LR55]|uniref:hypothetical protein n=1 Tax=Sphingomonas sp. LR55 TaxID=3050231 RepID=UPI002FE1650C
MRTKLIVLLTLAFGLSLGACDGKPAPQAANSATAEDPVAQDVKQIEYGVRLAAANKRIDELERKVGELENTPEKLDLDLLNQRIAVLEANAAEGSTPSPAVASDAGKDRLLASPRRVSSEIPRTQTKAPKLTLPELETRSRPATPAEVKAFSAGPRG